MNESKFQFINPYLLELNFEVNKDFAPDDEEIGMENSFNIQVAKSNTENRANVELILEINKTNENAPFKIKARIASDFKWENLEEHQAEKLLETNAPALLLGYLRPIIASITNSSNFPSYNLPFMNFKK